MSRRYDSRTTIFSPEGRLYQVEYAMEAISNAGSALGVLATDGVVLAAEKKITSKVRRCLVVWPVAELQKRTAISALRVSRHDALFAWPQLLDTKAVGVRREKMYKLDDHIACAVAGMTGMPPPPETTIGHRALTQTLATPAFASFSGCSCSRVWRRESAALGTC